MQPGGVLSMSDTGKNTRNLLGTLPVSVGKILSYLGTPERMLM